MYQTTDYYFTVMFSCAHYAVYAIWPSQRDVFQVGAMHRADALTRTPVRRQR
jgi:hypothetical protein